MLRSELGHEPVARRRAVLRLWWPAAGAVLLVAMAATYTRTDPDLWGHVRYGLDLLETGRLDDVDPYSFTQDRPWVNHEWLSELVMAVAWERGGPAGLALLKGSLTFATFVVLWSALAGTRFWVRCLIMVLAFFGTVHMTSSLRPQLWSFLGLAVMCRAFTSDRWRQVWWLPLLFVVWVNTHGGWVVGLGVLGAWSAGRLLADPRTWPRWTLLPLLCGSATLINPYGIGLWRFIVDTVRPARDVVEWQPLWTATVFDWIPWLALTGTALWLLRRGGRHGLATAAVLLMLAYGSMRVLRLESLFVVAGIALLGERIAAAWPSRLPSLPRRPPAGEWIVAATAFLVLAAGAGRIGWTSLRCQPMRSPWMPDQAAARLIRAAESGRLVVYFDWGQFALWHLGPEVRVSMDGRRETVYSDVRLDEHDAIVAGTPGGLATLAEWRPEYVWLPAASEVTRRWLADNGYRIELRTESAFIAVRDDVPLLVPAEPAPTIDSRDRCFPG